MESPGCISEFYPCSDCNCQVIRNVRIQIGKDYVLNIRLKIKPPEYLCVIRQFNVIFAFKLVNTLAL